MKKSGISRRIDDLGRITIPMEMRRNLGINDGDMLDISSDGDGIVLSKSKNMTAEARLAAAIKTLEDCSAQLDGEIGPIAAASIKSKAHEIVKVLKGISTDTGV